jgi:DNA-binding MarR family transcriptional regulator
VNTTGAGCAAAALDILLPWNATVTYAGVDATYELGSGLAPALALNASLSATGAALAVNLSLLIGATTTLTLAPEAVTRAIAVGASTEADVTVRVEAAICSPLGSFTVRFDGLNISYFLNGSAPTPRALPAFLNFTVNGAAGGAAEAGVAFALGADTPSHDLAAYNVTWSIDGATVGGAALAALSLPEGNHSVVVRVANATASRDFAYTVAVGARPALPPGGPLPVLLIGVAIAGIAGMAVASTDAGRYLLFASGSGVFARLKKASLLDHFVRGSLYQVIRENPGIHFAELRRRAQVANGAASHHLRTLEKGGYIKVVIDGTKTKFYTTDRPLEAEVYGISDTERAILSAVTDAPGIGQGELAVRLAKSNSAVSRAVSKLAALGYVTTRHEGARVLVFPREGAAVGDPLSRPWPDEGA